MKTFKIILAIILGGIILGNILMMIDGDFKSYGNYIVLMVFIITEIFLIRSIKREPKKNEQ